MTKYELSLTKEYVPDWTLVDAMRELFQNALDQQTVSPDNEMFWEHSGDVFKVGNKLSILEPKSLLLGATTKADDAATIGKFGEGYKIATLVLTRLGKTVTFYNYGAKEVWRARFSKSRKYNAEILVFEVDKKFPWTTVPDNNLTITIEGVTEQEFLDIQAANLHISGKLSNFLETPQGKILLDPDLKGKMFVHGLYICTADKFNFGYDFNPDKVQLDRDRKLIRDFDLKWTTSQMWLSSQDEKVTTLAADLVESGSADTSYITDVTYGFQKLQGVSDKVTERFTVGYGKNAVPVTSQIEAELVPPTHKAIVVSETLSKVIRANDAFVQPASVFTPSLADKVDEWLKKHGRTINRNARRELQAHLDDEKQDDIQPSKEDSWLPY